MAEKGVTPNNNTQIIRMLSKELWKCNKNRNRILLGAVVLCIVTLTMIFGIFYGKVQAEYLKAVRAAGTAASTYIEDADQSQYRAVSSLGYVKQVGRRVIAGKANAGEQQVFDIQWLDQNAWEHMAKPAYTDIYGSYPKKKQEIMLSEKVLKVMGIDKPKIGTKICVHVNLGLFKSVQEEFVLCGWYKDYIDEVFYSPVGYIAKTKIEEWGYDIEEKSDILICQSDDLDWRETEEKLYQDVQMKNSGQMISAANTYTYDAVNQVMGGYEMVFLGTIVVLSGMFFLIYNVMCISMAGDIRQMGLLNIIGTTKKQIQKIYYGQIQRILVWGVLIGTIFSMILLVIIIPEILGRQYLSEYGGENGLKLFRFEILAASVMFTVILVICVGAGVVHHVVNDSCVESLHYTGLEKKKKEKYKKIRTKKRSADREICYMAWQNVIRYRERFLLTVFSLFLGMEALLGVVVITAGSDYEHAIEKRPDFLIAGQFSGFGQDMGYGNEYKSRNPDEDPMETEGNNFMLLDGNDYDEFSPISAEVKDELWEMPGVNKAESYVMQGAYMISTVSRKGIRPLESGKEEVNYDDGAESEMIESPWADVIQILSNEEISDLKEYVSKNHLSVDMESLENGTGVMVLHDHKLSPTQEKQAEESIGEPVYFTSLLPKEALKNREAFAGKRSENFKLSGYLDNRAEGFPPIPQTWHGSEGSVYYLISEKGFDKLPTQKKTLYMELNVDRNKEQQIKSEIQKIVSNENDEKGEAGIFCISKSDMLLDAEKYIQGNRLILGSISAVLLFAGLTNYFNVMVTGILSRKKELEIIQSIGMTEKQKRKMLLAEGAYYCLIVAFLMLTLGSGSLKLISDYMEKKLSYFEFRFPVFWMLGLIGDLAVICLVVPMVMGRNKGKGRKSID